MRPMALRRATLALIVVLAAGTGGAVTVADAPPAGETAGIAADPSRTTIRIALQPDGDAHWTVTVRFGLGSEREGRAFEALAAEYESGGTRPLSPGPFREAADRAEPVVDRPMTIRGVSRSTDRSNATGVLRLSFTWTNFTRTGPNDRLVLGDVFRTESGTWLPAVESGQTLIIEFPEGYAARSSSPGPRNGTIRISGYRRLEPGTPSATLVPTDDSTPGGGDGDGNGGPSLPASALAGALAVVVLVATALARYAGVPAGVWRREEEPPEADAEGSEPDEGEAALLSDEERVERLLRENGGRMKQVDIVEETDWSNAKVSQLLSEMAEEGRIDKLRIGRENLISLPDEE